MSTYDQTLTLVVSFIGLGVICGGFAFGCAYLTARFRDVGGTLRDRDE